MRLRKVFKDCKDWKNENGSISPLITGLFLVLLVLSAGLINIADSFLAKRELFQIVEPRVQASVQILDLDRYYAGNSLDKLLNQISGNRERIPIDCGRAISRAKNDISQLHLRDASINIEEITCFNDELIIKVNSEIHPIISFPIFTQLLNSKEASKGMISINATVGATSVFQ